MKIIVDEINTYIEYCKKNPKTINKYRKLLIKNIVIPTLERDDVFFDEVTYRKCLKYCESNYYPLFPYQKFVYAFVFMYINDTPLFSTIFIEMGRGNGKDGFMMPLANFLQTPLYGVRNYNIDIIANNEDQAHDSFDVVYDMLDGNNKFKGKFDITKERIINTETHARLRYNTSNAKTKDGKKGGLLLFNEYHAYETYGQINVFTSQLGKIKHPRKIIITTNGYVRGGPLDDILSACIKILETGENYLGYFPFICCLDDIKEVDDEDMWIKANPSSEFMPVLKKQIKDDYLEAKEFPSKWQEFVTKRMNMPERNEEVTVASWEQILKACYKDTKTKEPIDTPDLKSKLAVIGIDFADVRDFASAGLLFKIDDIYIWRQHTWICKNSPTFNNIKFPINNYGQNEFCDYEIVDSTSLSIKDIVLWCIDKMSLYSVQKIVMDTYRFSLFRECFEEYGFTTETKANPYGIIRMLRRSNSIYAMVAPKIEKAFADGKVNYGASAIMRWYTNNTEVSIDKFGNKAYQKIEPILRKNDGFMAMVSAMSADNLLEQIILRM